MLHARPGQNFPIAIRHRGTTGFWTLLPVAQASLWEASCADRATPPPLAGAQHTGIAIIGGGYTGLSASLHLAEAGAAVILLDAEKPGWGGSGRNGGQVIAGVKDDPDALISRFGEAAGRAMADAVGAGPDLVFALIERHAIRCSAQRAGWLQAAVSGTALARLRDRARQWQAMGVPVRVLDQVETASLTGTSVYCGALLDPRGGTLHPLAYARGLAQAAAASGATLHGGSPALKLSRDGRGWRIETPGGSLTADKVILATNAYSGRLHDGLRRSLVAVPSFQVATAPLPPGLVSSILAKGQAVSDTWRLLRYFRVAEGRLLMGTRGSYANPPPATMIARMRSAIAEIYPQASHLALDYAWGGMVAVTADHLPHLHELAPALFAGAGFNGRGVAMATVMGRELARAALGQDCIFPKTALRPIRLHRFSRLGAQAAIQTLRSRDAAEKKFPSVFDRKAPQNR